MPELDCASLDEDKKEKDKEDKIEDLNAQTIKPTKSPGAQSVPLTASLPEELVSAVEDYSDLAPEEDEQRLQEKVANFKVNFTFSIIYRGRPSLITLSDEKSGQERPLSSRRHQNCRYHSPSWAILCPCARFISKIVTSEFEIHDEWEYEYSPFDGFWQRRFYGADRRKEDSE